MKVIYDNERLILIESSSADFNDFCRREIGVQRIAMAHEVWTFRSVDQKFFAYKNKGSNELVGLLAESGIELRTTAASLRTGDARTLTFVSDRDRFLFKLKFGK